MKNIEQMVQDNRRLIENEARKHSANVPETFVLGEAFKLAHEAAKNYDEKSGAKFSTYLVSQLQPLSRLSSQYGNFIRLPENQQMHLNKINHARANLTDALGRDPTVNELSQNTGINIGMVDRVLKSKKKDVNVSSLQYLPVFVDNDADNEWIHFVYNDLPERDKFIFEHKTGFGGKPVLENSEIAKKLNISQSLISQRVKMISDKIKEGVS